MRIPLLLGAAVLAAAPALAQTDLSETVRELLRRLSAGERTSFLQSHPGLRERVAWTETSAAGGITSAEPPSASTQTVTLPEAPCPLDEEADKNECGKRSREAAERRIEGLYSHEVELGPR